MAANPHEGVTPGELDPALVSWGGTGRRGQAGPFRGTNRVAACRRGGARAGEAKGATPLLDFSLARRYNVKMLTFEGDIERNSVA